MHIQALSVILTLNTARLCVRKASVCLKASTCCTVCCCSHLLPRPHRRTVLAQVAEGTEPRTHKGMLDKRGGCQLEDLNQLCCFRRQYNTAKFLIRLTQLWQPCSRGTKQFVLDTLQEDRKVVELVAQHGAKKWSLIASNLPGRIGKQCRERWVLSLLLYCSPPASYITSISAWCCGTTS